MSSDSTLKNVLIMENVSNNNIWNDRDHFQNKKPHFTTNEMEFITLDIIHIVFVSFILNSNNKLKGKPFNSYCNKSTCSFAFLS